MKYQRSTKFKKSFEKLPRDIQEKAVKAFQLFKTNPRHPSLGVKKIQGREDVWEGRIDIFYRFTFEYHEDEKDGETICWFLNIGPHDIVDQEAR